MKIYLRVICAALVLALYGCGDDGGGGGPVGDGYVFPAGKATVTFSAMSTARLSAPVSGIDLSITLPAGMSVATSGGSSGRIENASVVPGAGLTGTNLAFGTYSASTNKVHLSMATTSDTFRSGEFLRLTCAVASRTSITLGILRSLNTPVTLLKGVGYYPASKSTKDLTGALKVALGAVR